MRGQDSKKTKAHGVRLTPEIMAWVEDGHPVREIIEDAYAGRTLDLRGFRRACDRKHIDYQLAINRMVQLINED